MNLAFCLQTGAYEIADEVAEELGVKPDLRQIFFKSPSLAYKILLGPVLPAHYRLIGPGASERCWQQAHDYYDRLYPGDLPGKLGMLGKGLLGCVIAGLTLPVLKDAGIWQLLDHWNGST